MQQYKYILHTQERGIIKTDKIKVFKRFNQYKFCIPHLFSYVKLHRENGPSYSEYNKNGKLIKEAYYIDNKLYRENGPAEIEYFPFPINKIKSETYYYYPDTDTPTVYKKILVYYTNGQLKTEKWLINNVFHRENAPAYVRYNKKGNIIDTGWYIVGYNIKNIVSNEARLSYYNKYIDTIGGFMLAAGDTYKKKFPEIYQAILKKKSLHIFD